MNTGNGTTVNISDTRVNGDIIFVNLRVARDEALEKGGREQIHAAAVAAVAETLLGDRLAVFEADIFVHRIAHFIRHNQEFATLLSETGTKFDLHALPNHIESWAAENPDVANIEEAKISVGAAYYLTARFERAFELLTEAAAKRTKRSGYCAPRSRCSSSNFAVFRSAQISGSSPAKNENK